MVYPVFTHFIFASFSIFPKRENIEAIGERLNRQLQVPRQNAFGKLTWKA
jgi:hypothetical protein